MSKKVLVNNEVLNNLIDLFVSYKMQGQPLDVNERIKERKLIVKQLEVQSIDHILKKAVKILNEIPNKRTGAGTTYELSSEIDGILKE